jgi:hypothetical protein
MSNEDFEDFSFGEDDKKARPKASRFKGEKNHKYRISFAWWKEVDEDGKPDLTSKPRFIGQQAHWVDHKGYFLNKDPSSPDGKKIASLCGSDPRWRSATMIVKWPCTKSGKIIKDELGEGAWEVLPWVFDSKKYNQIMAILDDYPYGENDLIVEVTNSDFQHMTFLPKSGSMLETILSKGKKSHIKSLLEDIEEGSKVLGAEIGKKVTPKELRNILSGKPAADAAAVADDEIEDVDALLAAGMDDDDDDDDDDDE